MDTMQRIKGLNLSPLAVGYADQFGQVTNDEINSVWTDDIFGNIGDAVVDGAMQEHQQQQDAKGKWWKENGAQVLEALPDLYCMLWPKNCQANSTPPNYPSYPPAASQPKRDWLSIGLIVVVLLVLVIIIIKK